MRLDGEEHLSQPVEPEGSEGAEEEAEVQPGSAETGAPTAESEAVTAEEAAPADEASAAVPEQSAPEQETPEPAAEPEPAVEESDEEVAASMEAYLEAMDELRPGQMIQGRLVRITPDGALVDVGQKSEGLIPRKEVDALGEELSEGQQIDVYVVQVEDAEGNLVVSKRQADYILAWDRLEEARKNREVLTGTVFRAVKGGLLADLGHLGQGFIPASETDTRRVRNLEGLVGEVVKVQVLEVDPERKRVVLSRKNVLVEERRRVRQEVLSDLREGQIRKGTVRRITDFGAFVDIGGGVEGLLHVSELAWIHVAHPQEVLQQGEEIEVMVLKVERERNRISLGRRQLLPDPWKEVGRLYQVGDIIEGKVTRVVSSGAFVRLQNGVEGFIRAGELGERRVRPEQVVEAGQEVRVKVLQVDPQARRIALSFRQAQQEASREEYAAHLGDRERVGSTVGDLFGDELRSLRAQLTEDDLPAETAAEAAQEEAGAPVAEPVDPAEAEDAAPAEPPLETTEAAPAAEPGESGEEPPQRPEAS